MLSHLEVYDDPNEKTAPYYQVVGGVTALLVKANLSDRLNVSYFRSIVRPAFLHQKIKCYFDASGAVAAYVVWCSLTEEVDRRLITTFKPSLHISEWNEGEQLWIIDLVAPFGHLKYVLKDLSENVFCDIATARYLRSKRYAGAYEVDRRHGRFRLSGAQACATM